MKLMQIEKRGVNVVVNELGNDKQEIVLNGESYETHATYVRGAIAWSVPADACKKHFGVNDQSYIEHGSAKKVFNARDKHNKESVAFFEKQRKEFYGEVE